MVVAHNLSASNANRNLGVSTGTIKKHTEKLSSGYKINRAADDAAGLTISEKMRSQIRGLTQASANAQDGISFVQTADGTLDEVSAMLKRSKELAVKASTETLTEADRAAIQSEIKSICDEIDRVQESSTFNDFRIFSEAGYPPSEAGVVNDVSPVNAETNIPVVITLGMIDANGDIVGTTTGLTTGTANSFAAGSNEEKMANFLKGAVSSAVGQLQSAYPDLMDAASTGGVQIGLELGNIDGVGTTLAYVRAG
ncbi:MAG: flagellin, partial [Lachnospiraceae bacterium]|nr:flagellin [Lachnospiraceae bacterium]